MQNQKIYTKDAAKVMFLAQEEAQRKQSPLISEDHLLVGILRQETGIAAEVLKAQKKGLDELRTLMPKGVEFRFLVTLKKSELVHFTVGAQEVIDRAQEEASEYGHLLVDTEHIMLAMLHYSLDGSISSQVLKGVGLDFSSAKRKVIQLMAAKTRTGGFDSKTYKQVIGSIPTVREFGLDLSREAMKGMMDPVVGRSKEIARVTQIVGRRTKK
jgi:ATP-dependent Clp protease ATP-binding subunit ClpC